MSECVLILQVCLFYPSIVHTRVFAIICRGLFQRQLYSNDETLRFVAETLS